MAKAFRILISVETPDGRTTQPLALAEATDVAGVNAFVRRLTAGAGLGFRLQHACMERVRYLLAMRPALARDAVVVPRGEGANYSDLAFWQETLPDEFPLAGSLSDAKGLTGEGAE